MNTSTIALFCCLYDFGCLCEAWERHRLVPTTRKRIRKTKLTLGEMMFIMTLFHLSPYRNFKRFWLHAIEGYYRDCFGDLPSYGRFVALMPRLLPPYMLLLHHLCQGSEKTGLYIIDSTRLAVCHNARSSRHRVFKGLAARGRTAMGWFYGFKMHVVINSKGQLMAVQFSPGNTDDRVPLEALTVGLQGRIPGDKGYISKARFDRLWRRGLQLLTRIRINRRNYLMPIADKMLLRQRFTIETLFGTLKRDMELEHTRHRSVDNAFLHILSCLVAYTLGKPGLAMKTTGLSTPQSPTQPTSPSGPCHATCAVQSGHLLFAHIGHQGEK